MESDMIGCGSSSSDYVEHSSVRWTHDRCAVARVFKSLRWRVCVFDTAAPEDGSRWSGGKTKRRPAGLLSCCHGRFCFFFVFAEIANAKSLEEVQRRRVAHDVASQARRRLEVPCEDESVESCLSFVGRCGRTGAFHFVLRACGAYRFHSRTCGS